MKYLTCGGLELAHDDFCRHNLVDQITHRHLYDFNTAQNMTPADAVNDKLVNFLAASFQETSVVLTVVVIIVTLLSPS